MFAETDLMKDKRGKPYCDFAKRALDAMESSARLAKRANSNRRLDRSEKRALAGAMQ